jgi:23S rRNA pseudouridine1911/1915/1917 synthase
MPETGDAREATLVVADADAGTRLDQFLARHLPALSRSQIQRLIKTGCVRLDAGTIASKPSLEVHAGLTARVLIPEPAPATPQPEALPLTVLHDDADIAVIDKPAGLVVHPGAGHATGTLVNALLHHLDGLSGIGGERRPGIVHRLDKGTSGVMVVAKTDRAHRELARQFHDREIGKEYVALVWGAARAGRTMDVPIGRDRRQRTKMSSRASHARTALTTILAAEPLGGVTLVRVAIGTGRTHQIRVHLSEAGHPVVGDALYGGVRRIVPAHLVPVRLLDRPFLHAARLTLTHPRSGERMTFEAPLPPDLSAVADALRAISGGPTHE